MYCLLGEKYYDLNLDPFFVPPSVVLFGKWYLKIAWFIIKEKNVTLFN